MKTAIVALALVVGVATAASSLGQQPAAVSDTSGRDVPQFFSTAFLEKLFPSIALQTGENAYLVSDYFCDFVMSEPERFFRVTVKYPKEFAWWLDRLPDLSFTDYGGCDTSQDRG